MIPNDKQLKNELDEVMEKAHPYCRKCGIEVSQEEWEKGGFCIQCI